jgi:hypothetical protein
MMAVMTGLAAAIMTAAGYAVGGQTGLLAAVALAAVAGLLAARLRIPGPPRRPSPPPPEHDQDAEFAAYRRIDSALGQARVSRRHFDHTARPLLQRLLAVLLADRRRLDMSQDTGAAREALEDDLWPLLDPARPASEDSRAPGVSEQTLARIVDRLEDL